MQFGRKRREKGRRIEKLLELTSFALFQKIKEKNALFLKKSEKMPKFCAELHT